VAAEILTALIGEEVEKDEVRRICEEIYTFGVPIERVYGRNYIMRLDQGPTASFKDFAALFMGRMMQYFLSRDNQHITILTATSGDTGSAVANAFYGLENIKVIILFPAGEVTGMQRKQMTTLDKNIQVIEIDGKFDDCQNLVKMAFMDPSLSALQLSSANSINIGRLLPQSVYYFWAWSRLSSRARDPIAFSVPCGNFGDLSGGLIAREMGLPVSAFVISTNENNEVPEFLRTGEYMAITPSKNCISSAMNVGHPSNLPRIVALYNGRMDEKGNIIKQPDLAVMRKDFFPVSVSDSETRETIKETWMRFKIILEPHGAVAWKGLLSYLGNLQGSMKEKLLSVSLETAHPAKFGEEINRVLDFSPSIPDSLLRTESKNEEYLSLGNNYNDFKKFLIKNY
jgi:threonine synthase